MKFGVFYEHQLPRPWQEGDEQRLFQDALSQVELADRLGFDYAWEVEHHFLEEYSHSSAPEVFLAACSQRTKRIRLGHGIVLMPPGYSHPAEDRLAHRHARPRQQRPRGLRHRRIRVAPRARGLRHRPGREEGDVARDHRAGLQHARDGPVPRLPGQVLLDALPQPGAEADPEAAPAALGRVLEPQHHPRGRAARHRRAHLRVHRPERGAPVGARLLRDLQARVRADRPRREPEHRDRGRVLGARRAGRGRAPRRATASSSSASRSDTTTCTASSARAAPTSGATSRSSRTCSPAPRAARSARRRRCARISSR